MNNKPRTTGLLQRLRKNALLLGLGLFIGASTASAQSTTSILAGRVTADAGLPMESVAVVVRHEPTGTLYNTSVRSNGTFTLRGLRPGGPYSVEARADGFAPSSLRGVFLELDRANEVSLELRPTDVFVLDELVVTGDPMDAYFQADRMGGATQLSSRDIAQVPVGDRSLNSLLRMDPRIIYNRDPSDRAFSASGASNRYNSIQIDGVSAADPFGLSGNNTAAERNVIPLDSVEAVQISTSPFDLRATGFTGAQVNAVTKSGTNEFSGSLYYLYRDQNLARTTLEGVKVPDFKEQTMGLTLGGPIIKDKLFFFVAYEKVDEDKNPPTVTNLPTADALARINAQASALGFDPGNLVSSVSNKLKDDNLLVKLDWNINQDHRLTFRFNTVESQRPTFPGYGGRNISFDSHWYSQDIDNTSYIAQMFSTWSDRLSTEISVSYSEYRSAPIFARRMPQVVIQNVPVQGTTQLGNVSFGTERSRHFNRLEVDTWTLEAVGSYELNLQNTLSFGYQYERKSVFNAFVQDFLGNYEFSNIEAFEAAGAAGWAGRYRYQFENPGVNPAAEYREEAHGLFIQNTYQPTDRLTVTGGVRVDIPRFGDKPDYNAQFEQTFKVTNNSTYSGASLWQPRVGFNYKLDDESISVIRGGFGLFYGSMPDVWMSNSYSNTGFNFSSVDLRNAATPALSPDPDNQPKGATGSLQNVVALDPDFKLPSSWKATLGYDRQMFGHVFTAELEMAWVNHDVLFVNLNRTVDLVAGDGRNIIGARVDSGFANETIYLTNTNKGSSNSLVLAVERPTTQSGWYYRASYTHTRVKEVQYGTSSVARSNWINRSILNQGEDVTSRGELEIQHRFLGILSKEFKWAEGYATRVALVYEGRSGLPYSLRYSTDVNGDGFNANDLVYIPTRGGDSLVRFANAQAETDFFRIVDRYGLKEGEVVNSGSQRYPFVHQFDLNFSQEIKLPGWKHSLEIGFDILNVGNLLNSSWGLIRGSNSFFVKSQPMVAATFDRATNQYVYSNPNTDLVDKEFNPHTGRGEPSSSRWTAMLSIRYKF